MRLYEFDGSAPSTDLSQELLAVTAQLVSNPKKIKELDNTQKLLQYYKNNDINLSVDNLKAMINNPPLNNYISNIQGDKVIFKGQADDTTAAPDEKDKNQEIVKSMANKAMKN